MLISEIFNESWSIRESSTPQLPDILEAKSLILDAMKDNNLRWKYFHFLKNLRDKKGVDYSTNVHKEAIKLVKS